MDIKELRKNMISRRIELDKDKVSTFSSIICNKILNSEIYNSSKVIYCYCSVKNEVDLKEVVIHALANKKIVAFPKIKNNEMNFYEINGYEDLQPGAFGINEPISDKVASKPELIITPGLLFTKGGKRIGYGGGYYDRYLKENSCHTIGVCYDFQVFDNLSTKPHDMLVDEIITN